MALLNAVLSYHALTIWMMWILFVSACAGVILAVVGWYVILPLIRRSGRKDNSDPQ
jgi:hypothetical protein